MKHIKLSKKATIIIVIVYSSIAVFTFVLYNQYKDRIFEKYPEVHKNDMIDAVVSDFFIDGGAFVTLNDSIFISFFGSVSNPDYWPKEVLKKYIQIGDTVKKNAGSDTVCLSRPGEAYYFLINSHRKQR